jgi:6-phosphofructokinase 1
LHSGTLLVGQSGGGTAVINASLAGIITRAQEIGISRILGMRHGVEGLLDERFVDLSSASTATLEALRHTPSGALGLCRHKLQPGDELRIIDTLRRWHVRWLLYIGGNDSAATAERIDAAAKAQGYELAVVSVPKTIDNDLVQTDHTPGYGTAARFIATATRFLGADARAMRSVDQVRILEVYGRDTGWLAAASALARDVPDDPPHLILTPETPFREDHFFTVLEKALSQHGFAVVIAAEMLKDDAGKLIGLRGNDGPDPFGNAETRRPGEYLETLIERRLHVRAKDDRPGTLHKFAAWDYSSVDVCEAFGAGAHAVDLVMAGHTARMVTLIRDSSASSYACHFGQASVGEVAGQTRPLPDLFFDSQQLNVTAEFCAYARPLLGASLPSLARLHDLPVAPRP